MLSPVILTLVGSTGEGKSTAANDIIGEKHFIARGGSKSCTETISACEAKGGKLIVFDTPGIGDTAGRSKEFFEEITNHLHEHGGVVALVQSYNRVDERVKKRFRALSMTIGKSEFANSCVLITTKYSPDDDDPKEACRELLEYELALEKELSATFAQRYAYSKDRPELKTAFIETIRAGLPKLIPLKPGQVQRWEQILKLADGDLSDAIAQRDKLKDEVDRLEGKIAQTKANKSNLESWRTTIKDGLTRSTAVVGGVASSSAIAAAMAAETVILAPVAAATGALAIGISVGRQHETNLGKAKELDKELKKLEDSLIVAKKKLNQVNIPSMKRRASEIRRLIN